MSMGCSVRAFSGGLEAHREHGISRVSLDCTDRLSVCIVELLGPRLINGWVKVRKVLQDGIHVVTIHDILRFVIIGAIDTTEANVVDSAMGVTVVVINKVNESSRGSSNLLLGMGFH